MPAVQRRRKQPPLGIFGILARGRGMPAQPRLRSGFPKPAHAAKAPSAAHPAMQLLPARVPLHADELTRKFYETITSMKPERERQPFSPEALDAKRLATEADALLSRKSLRNFREAELRAYALLSMGAEERAVEIYGRVVAAYRKAGYNSEAEKLLVALRKYEEEKKMREMMGGG